MSFSEAVRELTHRGGNSGQYASGRFYECPTSVAINSSGSSSPSLILTTKPPDLPGRRKAKRFHTDLVESLFWRKSVKMKLKHEIKKAKETSLSSIFQGAVSAMQRKCVLIKKASHRYIQIRRLRSRSDKGVKHETPLQM